MSCRPNSSIDKIAEIPTRSSHLPYHLLVNRGLTPQFRPFPKMPAKVGIFSAAGIEVLRAEMINQIQRSLRIH